MRLKTYKAEDMMSAMRLVRDELGEDALIVSSRDLPDGKVHITAAVEKEDPTPVDPIPSFLLDMDEETADGEQVQAEDYMDDALAQFMTEGEEESDADNDVIDEVPHRNWFEELAEFEPLSDAELTDKITETLMRHRCPTFVNDPMIASAMAIDTDKFGDTASAMAEILRDNLRFATDLDDLTKKPIAFVGPAGSGKSLACCKFAAHATLMQDKKVIVINTDTNRAGADAQLKALLKIIDVPVLQAENAAALKKQLKSKKAKDADIILIDTAAPNPYAPEDMRHLSQLLHASKMTSVLVLPAAFDPEESAEMAQTFGVLGVSHLFPTRLDYARRLGGILSASYRGHLSIIGGSHTHAIADGLTILDADDLAQYLCAGQKRRQQS